MHISFLKINFWLCCVFMAALGLSLLVVGEGCSLAMGHRVPTAVASLEEHVLQGTQAVVVHGLRCHVACGVFAEQGWNRCPLLHW